MDSEANPNTENSGIDEEEIARPRPLPADLPRSLDDRQPVRHYGAETEIYDAWQGTISKVDYTLTFTNMLINVTGQSQFLSSPVPAQPLTFNLSLDDEGAEEDNAQRLQDNDSRLLEMLAAQAAHREDSSVGADEEAIVADKKISEAQKKTTLQNALHNAASNGDVEQIERLLKYPARAYIDINGPDEEGTAPIIYASCFVSGC